MTTIAGMPIIQGHYKTGIKVVLNLVIILSKELHIFSSGALTESFRLRGTYFSGS